MMNYKNYIGRKVIIRAENAGVFYGTMNAKKGTEVELVDCRRIWYWEGAASLSELALSGVTRPEVCKFTVVVPSIIITGVIEIIPCSEQAIISIESVPVWKVSK